MKRVIVHQTPSEIMISIVENDRLVEVFIEPTEDKSIVGSVYAGIVENVLPGMQAAFVDIGLDKNAYLYIEDVINKTELADSKKKNARLSIKNYLSTGQPLLVQIKKAPVDGKGARVTLDITLPGRYLVVMPHNDYIGISKRIIGPLEKNRLQKIASDFIKEGKGVVVRTAAEGKEEGKLRADYENLSQVWEEILLAYQDMQGKKGFIRGDVDFATRVLRDVVNQDIEQIVVMSESLYPSLKNYVDTFIPCAKGKIIYQPSDGTYGVKVIDMLGKALKRKVWIKNGGYLIIDKVEALSIIDVNTGKFTGKKSLEITAYKTNMLAAVEVARQIRLRNMGGIIIVDFIDMKEPQHRYDLLQVLEKETAKDTMKVQVMGITSLGLVEMTREKAKRSLSNLLEKTCPTCQGKGTVLSEDNILRLIYHRVSEAANLFESKQLSVEVNPRIYRYIKQSKPAFFKELEETYDKEVVVIPVEAYAYDKFEVEGLS